MFLIFSISGRCCCSVHLSVLLFSVLCIHFSLSHAHTRTPSLALSSCPSFSSLCFPLYILFNSFIPPPFFST